MKIPGERTKEAMEVRYKLLRLVPRFAAAIKNAFRVYGALGAAAYVFDHFRVTWAERAKVSINVLVH